MKFHVTVEDQFCTLLCHVARNLHHALDLANALSLVDTLKRHTTAIRMMNLVPSAHS